VKIDARLEHEYIQNYKALQNAFKKVNIEKVKLNIIIIIRIKWIFNKKEL
jgi:hypothetical protein